MTQCNITVFVDELPMFQYKCCFTAENSWRLVATKEMALLIICFAYTGLSFC